MAAVLTSSPCFLLPDVRRGLQHVVSDMCIVFVIVVCSVPTPSVWAVNLTCYSCYTNDPNDVCYTNVSLAPSERCNDDVPNMACSVYREDVFGEFSWIIRSCNTSCVEKCGVWGTQQDISKCSTCCHSDLCNVDDAAPTPWSATATRLKIVTMAVVASGLPFVLSG